MSCLLHLASVAPGCRVIRKGSEPRRPVTWEAKAWLVLPNGEKHTHSATVPGQTVYSLVPYMGALIDTLIADHGNAVRDAGWSAMTHGGRK